MTKTRVINAAGLELIKRYEGLRLEYYVCPSGYPTIGYGHRIKHEEADYLFSTTITENEAIELLKKDLKGFEEGVELAVKVPLTDNQFSALVSWSFNLGLGNLQSSTLLQKVNAGEHIWVPSEMIRWIYSASRPLKGLLRRRIDEAALYLA